jgi:hypothetical protein
MMPEGLSGYYSRNSSKSALKTLSNQILGGFTFSPLVFQLAVRIETNLALTIAPDGEVAGSLMKP